MTPAEFKTIRESLGLTAQWVADRAGVKLRTVQYWESGRMSVPTDVAELLHQLDARFEASVFEAIDVIRECEVKLGQPPGEVFLLRYKADEDLWRFMPEMHPLPATSHAAMIARLYRACRSHNIPVKITYMRPAEYVQWLNGRRDSTLLRSEWAAMK